MKKPQYLKQKSLSLLLSLCVFVPAIGISSVAVAHSHHQHSEAETAHSLPITKENIAGTWQCAVSDDEISISSVDNMMANGKATSEATFVLRMSESETVKLNMAAEYNWSVVGDELHEKLLNVKITSTDNPMLASLMQKALDKENPNTTSKIVHLSKNEVVYRETTENTMIKCKR